MQATDLACLARASSPPLRFKLSRLPVPSRRSPCNLKRCFRLRRVSNLSRSSPDPLAMRSRYVMNGRCLSPHGPVAAHKPILYT